jgi:lysozyme
VKGKFNEKGLAILKGFEQCCLHPYLCAAGIPTIAWGSIWDLRGNRVTMDTESVTQDEADFLLDTELRSTERSVSRLVTIRPLSSNQFSALVSWTYNLGSGNLQSSTMRVQLNRGRMDAAANELIRWNRAGGRILRGLVRRRRAERALFLTPDEPPSNMDIITEWLSETGHLPS